LLIAAVAFRLLTQSPKPALGGAVVAGVFLLAFPLVEQYFPIASAKLAGDFEALGGAYRCLLNTTAAAAAHLSLAASLLLTTALTAAPFTLSLTLVTALAAVDAAVDAFTSLAEGMAAWVGQTYAALALLKASAELAPLIAAGLSPLAALYMPERRAAFAAAYAAALPYLAAVAVLLAPHLHPLATCPAPPTARFDTFGLVNATSPTAAVVELVDVGRNATWWVTAPGQWALPANTTYAAKAVWMWVEVPVTPAKFYLPPSAPAPLNATAYYSRTAYLTWLNGTAASVAVEVPRFDSYGGWTYAVTPAPTRASREELEWTFEWHCRGYASQCSTEWRIVGTGLFSRVDVTYEASDHVDVSYSATLNDRAMVDERWWEAVCGNSTGYCPPYPTSPVKDMEVVVRAVGTPAVVCQQVGNSTHCEEVVVDRWVRAKVVARLAEWRDAPALAGLYYNGAGAGDVLASLLWLAGLAGPGGVVAKYLAAPVGWIIGSLVPYLVGLIYAEAFLLFAVAGFGLFVAGEAPILRTLYASLLAGWRWAFDPVRTALPWLRRGLITTARGAHPTQQIAASPTREAVSKVVEPGLRVADMAKLYAASVARAAYMLWYGSPLEWTFAAPGIFALYRHFRLTGARRGEALGKAVHHFLTPSGLEVARRVEHFLWLASAAVRLRVEVFAALLAKALAEAYRRNLALVGERYAAVALTLWYGRAAMPHEAAAYALVHRVKTKYFYADPHLVAEELRHRFMLEATPAEAAKAWLRHHGLDPSTVDKLREAGAPMPEKLALLSHIDNRARALAEKYLTTATTTPPSQTPRKAGASIAQVTVAADAVVVREVERAVSPGYRVLAHGRFLWVERGGPYPREVVEELAARGYVVTGPAWREFGGVPPGEGAPIVVEHGSASVNPLWLAWRTYDMRYVPSEGLLVVEFGGPYGLEDVIVQASMADRLAGSAASYIEALMESPRALAMALAEAAKRREVEEAAEALARLGAAEELARAIEAASAESASTDTSPPIPPAQAAEESASVETAQPTPPAAEEAGVEEAASGQKTHSGVKDQLSELAVESLSRLAVEESITSTQPVELATPQESAGETPSGLGRVGEEAGAKEVAEPVSRAEAGREPRVDAAVRELAHRLYSLGIDVDPSVLASYVEKYGEGAFDVVVRDVAKALAASYRVPYAAAEAEELVKKYGVEQASAALRAAKEEAAGGEDVREVLRRLLNQ